jgi:hypothetical protein
VDGIGLVEVLKRAGLVRDRIAAVVEVEVENPLEPLLGRRLRRLAAGVVGERDQRDGVAESARREAKARLRASILVTS